MAIRVSAPFTEGRYYGKGERPNTELARNSTFPYRRIKNELEQSVERFVKSDMTE
ncbi:MAG: hypothetical protein WBP64_07805 [Nitrososphaeraceae archaeon]